ncbi:IS1182 family transposase ISMac20 [Dissulfurispira thermophila]|uniref:IS1182 family transposase ISMac20 n=2 Tax=root TaxID=1 RepID=A0A7G1H2H7_9BACT|nr:IS1182 family transposase [Dissulfurispira thermophila]BCB96343.1 IS1182 family transposase ISMac20 [Dissulfurispira thermophila]
MAYIQSYRGQTWLLPPSIEDMIPEDHICFLVESLVESLDYREFDMKYAGAGHPAYHPRILLKLLIMGVLDKVRSSCMLARSARENIVYIYLSEKLTPDFRTISDFRKNNPELIKEVFKHTVGFAKQEGLLDLSHLATDGSKVKANASNRRVMTKEELEALLRFVEEELQEWTKQDTIEDKKFAEMRGFDQLPKQSKKTIQKAALYYIKRQKEKGERFKAEIIETLQKAQEEIENEGLKKVNTTDPGSRFMKNKSGRIEFSYNSQVIVDKAGFILANDVCQDAVDNRQLQPQVLETKDNIGELFEETAWSFDSGYFEGSNINFLTENKIDGYIPDNNAGKATNEYDKKNFIYNEASNEYICPENKRLIKMFPYEAERNAMAAKMKTPQAKGMYRLRQQIVEPVIGDIKENKGLRGFLTRGIRAVRAEFNIVCAAVNIKRIWLALQETTKGNSPILWQSA